MLVAILYLIVVLLQPEQTFEGYTLWSSGKLNFWGETTLLCRLVQQFCANGDAASRASSVKLDWSIRMVTSPWCLLLGSTCNLLAAAEECSEDSWSMPMGKQTQANTVSLFTTMTKKWQPPMCFYWQSSQGVSKPKCFLVNSRRAKKKKFRRRAP